jgi:hypothetical protein
MKGSGAVRLYRRFDFGVVFHRRRFYQSERTWLLLAKLGLVWSLPANSIQGIMLENVC